MKNLICSNDISVKLVLTDQPYILARATVIFLDCIETHGWRVMPSRQMNHLFNEEIWIQAPSVLKGNKEWKEIVYINDKNAYETIQQKIYDAYFMARQKDNDLKNSTKITPNQNIDIDQLSKDIENANLQQPKI